MSAVPNARPVSGKKPGVAGTSSAAGQPVAAAGPSPAAPSAPPANVQEFVIRVPKNLKKHHHVMRFNATLNVDFAQWKMVKLERENNLKEFRNFDEDMPKFGAGSEYNRELREEVRRKKYGIVAKRYKPEAQPWILKVGGKSGKKFRGIREGGVGENAAFYVFAHAPDGAIEAYPLNEWYNFQPIQRYKALSAEEAEHEFGRRKKVMNFFSLMMRKRLKNDEEEPVDPEEAKANKLAAKRSKELKISDMDEWIDSDEESSESDDDEEAKEKRRKTKAEEDSDDGAAAKKKKGKGPEKKKKKRDPDDEAFEESDDGDEEGRELDYISDSSDSEPDPEAKANKEMSSVAEEDALRKLLTSDEDSDEEKKSGDSDKDESDAKARKNEAKEAAKEAKANQLNGKKLKKLKKKADDPGGKRDTSSELSSNSSDSDDSSTGGGASTAPAPKAKSKKGKTKDERRSASPAVEASNAAKRKVTSMPSDLGGAAEVSNTGGSSSAGAPVVKRPRPEPVAVAASPTFGGPSTSSGGGMSSGMQSGNRGEENGITEDAVRRYLMRKPMTTTELLTKFKNKKTGVSSEKLVETMTQILKKINPVKQMIQGKMYLSIKTK